MTAVLQSPEAFHARPRKVLLRNEPVGERPRLCISESAIRGRRCMNGVGRLLYLGAARCALRLACENPRVANAVANAWVTNTYRQFQQSTTS